MTGIHEEYPGKTVIKAVFIFCLDVIRTLLFSVKFLRCNFLLLIITNGPPKTFSLLIFKIYIIPTSISYKYLTS